MEGFLLCNGDETLAIVEPTGDTIAVLEAHRNVLHKETWNISFVPLLIPPEINPNILTLISKSPY